MLKKLLSALLSTLLAGVFLAASTAPAEAADPPPDGGGCRNNPGGSDWSCRVFFRAGNAECWAQMRRPYVYDGRVWTRGRAVCESQVWNLTIDSRINGPGKTDTSPVRNCSGGIWRSRGNSWVCYSYFASVPNYAGGDRYEGCTEVFYQGAPIPGKFPVCSFNYT